MKIVLDDKKIEELLDKLRDVRGRVKGNLDVMVEQAKAPIDEWLESDPFPGQRAFNYASIRYDEWYTRGVGCVFSPSSNNSLGLNWWPGFPMKAIGDLLHECGIRETRLEEIDEWGVKVGMPLDVFTDDIELVLDGEDMLVLDSILKYT